jgi:hypothetical protein
MPCCRNAQAADSSSKNNARQTNKMDHGLTLPPRGPDNCLTILAWLQPKTGARTAQARLLPRNPCFASCQQAARSPPLGSAPSLPVTLAQYFGALEFPPNARDLPPAGVHLRVSFSVSKLAKGPHCSARFESTGWTLSCGRCLALASKGENDRQAK